MAPTIATPRVTKEKRISSVLEFAKELEDLLPTSKDPNSSQDLVDKLEHRIEEFPNHVGAAAAARCAELDNSGTALWNLCTRLNRKDDFEDRLGSTILTMARLYALMILDCAHNGGKGCFTNDARVMKVALKTAKACLELKELDFALKALEKAAEHEERLKNKNAQLTPEDTEACKRLSSEYFVLRTTLEWRKDRLDVAEHMFAKASIPELLLDPNTAENLADLLFEMGRELLTKSQHELAVKWLDRAFQVLNGQELDKLSNDASELRISIIQCSVQALLGIDQEEARKKAQNLVAILSNDIGDKLVVLLLKLELLSASREVFDSGGYATVLQKIIRSVGLTNSNFRLIMHHIRKLNDKSPSLACNAIDDLFQNRLFRSENKEMLETALVNRLWMATSQRDGPDVLSAIKGILDTIAANIDGPVGSSAAFAAQMLLWKRIESNAAIGQYDAAETWCRLGMHSVFDSAGDLNRAKIARKLLLCAISRLDTGGAREVYSHLPEPVKNDPKTRFLMFKVAIRDSDTELASECLEAVHHASSKDPNLLYACVLDAQEAGDRTLAIAALQLVFEKHQINPPSSIHLPALLRCTIRLMKSELDSIKNSESSSEKSQTVNNLCKVFEGAVVYAQRELCAQGPVDRLFDMTELDWFSKNAYNFALKHAADWDARDILRLLQSCVSFIGLYPKDIDQQAVDELSLRLIFCHFLATVLLVSLARAEDNIQIQLQDYLAIRNHIEIYDTTLQEQLHKLEKAPAEDLMKKLSTLLAYDFEAAVRLKKWDDLGEIVLKTALCKSVQVLELMADCILCCEGPTNVVIPVLKKIANEAWRLDQFEIVKQSKYMRCLFQYALPSGDRTAEELLDEIYAKAQELAESEQPYPAEELDWIATTAFNRAVDFYCAGEDASCNLWTSKAIDIASLCPDGGALQELLETKRLGLNWDT